MKRFCVIGFVLVIINGNFVSAASGITPEELLSRVQTAKEAFAKEPLHVFYEWQLEVHSKLIDGGSKELVFKSDDWWYTCVLCPPEDDSESAKQGWTKIERVWDGSTEKHRILPLGNPVNDAGIPVFGSYFVWEHGSHHSLPFSHVFLKEEYLKDATISEIGTESLECGECTVYNIEQDSLGSLQVKLLEDKHLLAVQQDHYIPGEQRSVRIEGRTESVTEFLPGLWFPKVIREDYFADDGRKLRSFFFEIKAISVLPEFDPSDYALPPKGPCIYRDEVSKVAGEFDAEGNLKLFDDPQPPESQ